MLARGYYDGRASEAVGAEDCGEVATSYSMQLKITRHKCKQMHHTIMFGRKDPEV